MYKEFIECLECAKKPGSPILCTSCVHNRGAIISLENENKKLKKTIEIIKSVTEL
jgi:hypothetical protein